MNCRVESKFHLEDENVVAEMSTPCELDMTRSVNGDVQTEDVHSRNVICSRLYYGENEEELRKGFED